MPKHIFTILMLLSSLCIAETTDHPAIALHDGCRDVENIKWNASGNNYSPLGIVLHKLGYLADASQQKYDLPVAIAKTLKVQVIDAPRHGILVLNETRSSSLPGKLSWMYHANPAYQGPDKAIYRVHVEKQRFDVTVNYFVHSVVVDNEHLYECENLHIGSLKID